MKTYYNTRQAAVKIGVGFRTLNRWLNLGTIRPTQGVPYGNGRILWVWSDADILKGRKLKSETHPGRKPKSPNSAKSKGDSRK